MSGESFILANMNDIKFEAQRVLQRIYNSREESRIEWVKNRYKAHAHAHRFWWNRHKLISEYEFITHFDTEYKCDMDIWDRISYSMSDAACGNQERALIKILALCDLSSDNTIHLSAEDASMLGYPKSHSIPKSDAAKEKEIAEQELMVAIS